jgi:hypothetical protein
MGAAATLDEKNQFPPLSTKQNTNNAMPHLAKVHSCECRVLYRLGLLLTWSRANGCWWGWTNLSAGGHLEVDWRGW